MKLPLLALATELFIALVWASRLPTGGTPVDKYFTADRNASVVGNSVVLECSSGAAASHLLIRRLDNGQELNSSQGLVSKLMYRFRSISCEDMGTYECELNRTDKMKTEIMVHNCHPKPCNGETVNKTVYALVNQTVNFSLCVVAVPDIFEYLKFNGTIARKKNYDKWTWDYQEIQTPGSSIKQFNISVFASALQTTEFGILTIRVFSLNGLHYFLDFNVLLRSPGKTGGAQFNDSLSQRTASRESKIASFAVFLEDTKDDSKFLKGNDIVLNCTVKGKPRTLRIIGPDLTTSFNGSSNDSFLVHNLRETQCKAMGSYKCVVDDIQVKERSLGIYDCGPQPCPGNGVNQTVFVYPGQPLRFVLCVLAYPGLYENMLINGVSIRKKDLSQRWSWDHQNSSFTYHLELAHNSILEPELGDLRLQIFSASGEQYVLEQFITLRAPGPPECPLKVTVTDRGIHYVTLSWTPGSDEGYPQRFHAFFSHDDVTWYRYDVIGEQRSANLTGLLRNSRYSFSVVSSNKLRQEIDAFTCDVFQSSTLFYPKGYEKKKTTKNKITRSHLSMAGFDENGISAGPMIPAHVYDENGISALPRIPVHVYDENGISALPRIPAHVYDVWSRSSLSNRRVVGRSIAQDLKRKKKTKYPLVRKLQRNS